jgi:hypothetical protein
VRALRAYEKFLLFLEPKHLELAIDLLHAHSNGSWDIEVDGAFRFRVEGYCSPEARAGIFNLVQKEVGRNVRVRRQFRPEIAYLEGIGLGLFAGFRIEGRLGEPDNFRDLVLGISQLISSGPGNIDRVMTSKSVAHLLLDRVEILIQLLEAQGDKSSLQRCAQLMEASGVTQINLKNELAAVRSSFLGTGEVTESCQSQWHRFSRLSPEWRSAEKKKIGDGLGHRVFNTGQQFADSRGLYPKYAVLADCQVFLRGIVTSGNSLITYDRSEDPSFDFVAGRWPFVVGSHLDNTSAIVKVPSVTRPDLAEGILLSSRAETNWYHWLIETLPRLLWVEHEVDASIPVLISSDIPDTAKESLRIVTNREVVEINPFEVTPVSKLIVLGPLAFHPDSSFMWGLPSSTQIHQESLKSFRDLILCSLGLEGVVGNSQIYVERSRGARLAVNRRAVERAAIGAGYRKITSENLPFPEQVRLFSGSRRVLLTGGAAMANLIFCQPNTKVTYLTSKFVAKYKLPTVLAGIAGARVEFCLGEPKGSSNRHSFVQKIHCDFRVKIQTLRKHLRS